ncbi:trafficking protein particle complex subunit 13 [Anaeramoeba flamelloides]|uniref:Trafficking protein particle complex subunit 13 n=1 Tax=Anaeramoeba flamelloides TaxID=1746091 RepID=A0ABQ8ZAJ5_9EUKA|nr:trafficking protein particle complex subunit 13 [Anaeramoeba flamelloides]
MVCQQEDILGGVLPMTKPQIYQKIDKIAEGQQAQGLSNFLTLSRDLKNLRLGEKFSLYISVHNFSNKAIDKVAIIGRMIVGKFNIALINTSNQRRSVLSAKSHYDHIIQTEVTHFGKHTLSFSLSFFDPQGLEKKFSKNFEFSVANPLGVKTKTVLLDSNIFLEAQIENRSKTIMYLEKVVFEPIGCFDLTDCNQIVLPKKKNQNQNQNQNVNNNFNQQLNQNIEDENFEKHETFSGRYHLRFRDKRQYLFILSPKKGLEKKAKSVTVIGKISVSWKSRFGQVGRLQTSHLQIKLPLKQTISITIESVPECVYLEEPFKAKCIIQNHANEAIPLRALFRTHEMEGIIIIGLSGINLGKIDPSEKVQLELDMLPIIPGIQTIGGIIVVNLSNHREYKIKQIVKLLVRQRDNKTSKEEEEK